MVSGRLRERYGETDVASASIEQLRRELGERGTRRGKRSNHHMNVNGSAAIPTRMISLAAKELQLLEYLVLNCDRVLPREEILQKVWQYDSEVNSRTVDVHVAWLRQKLDNPQSPRHIQTVRGKGYKFIS